VAASRVCCHSWLEGGFVMCVCRVCAQLQLRPAQLQLCMPSCQLRAVGHARTCTHDVVDVHPARTTDQRAVTLSEPPG
jgi:hypothetical protein